jgi:chloramphenicol O-acetyltransferase type A
MTQGRFIELNRWKRREHFDVYRALARPFWSVTVDVDVTRVWDAAARDRRSFFLATSFAALEAANGTEAFRLRMRPEGIWCHDAVGLSTTVLRADETFAFAVLRPCTSFNQFEADGRAAMALAHSDPVLRMPAHDVDDLVYHSSLPWISFSAFTNALGGGDDCIPRLVFGRVGLDGATRRMPVAVEVHHALVDGLDVARFLERFAEALKRPVW